MPLKLYNTLTRKKEVFLPIHKNYVGMYTCGPTVYWYQHIGNLKAYIFSDVLKRVLLHNNFNVKHIINITDVGHLTSDADTGEDKIEKAAKKEGKKAQEIADYYFDLFLRDLKKLNIIGPTKWTKATEHIKEQIELIKKLEVKGYTYNTSDGIYFDSTKFKNYGKLARLKIENLQEGKRIKIGEKKHKTDFALWKFSKKAGIRQQEWESPWGIGFPGWHIECSAMSMKYLGENFDIHTGGEDHIPVHHTNEIAQSEAATGKKFVNYWMHESFMTFKGEKISKSSGGLYTLNDLEKIGFSPIVYRYFNFLTHYRKTSVFSLDFLKKARDSYNRLKNIISELKDDKNSNRHYLKEFEKAVNDDLNMPKAIRVLWKFLRDKKAHGKIKTIKRMDEVFALDLLKKEKFKIPKEIQELARKREILRKEKRWMEADTLRREIKDKGFIVEDTENGPLLKRNYDRKV